MDHQQFYAGDRDDRQLLQVIRLSLPFVFQTNSNSFYVAQIVLTFNIPNIPPIPSMLLRLSLPSIFQTYLQFLLCCSDCPYLQYSKLNSNSFCVAQIVLTFCIPNIPPIPSMLLRLSLLTIFQTYLQFLLCCSDCPYLQYSKHTSNSFYVAPIVLTYNIPNIPPIPSMLLKLSLPTIFQTYLQFLLCCSDCPYLQYSKHTSNSFYVAQIVLTYNILNSTPIPSVLLRLSFPSVFQTQLQCLLCSSDCPYLQYSKPNSNSFHVG